MAGIDDGAYQKEKEAARARALALVGEGYIYGAKGQLCSPAFRRQQAAQYPEQAGTILGVGAKWDGKPVWDCAQLTRAVAKAAGKSLVSGATSQWTKTDWARKGTIDSLPAGELCFLYRRQSGSSRVMAHTGVSLGDGSCVHARGTAYGVVRQEMERYAWSHWGSLWAAERDADGKGPARDGQKGEEESHMETAYLAVVTAPGGETVNARDAPGGRLRDRLPLGTVVEVVEGGGDGWERIRYNGSLAYMQSRFLEKAEGEAQGERRPEGGEGVRLSLAPAVALALYQALGAAMKEG